jgi:pentatricopeptide repeat protein
MGCDNSSIVAQEKPLTIPQQPDIISQKSAERQPLPAAQQPLPATQQPNKSGSINSANFDLVERIANGLFKDGKLVEAINIYQKMIEEGYCVDFDIAGVGNF